MGPLRLSPILYDSPRALFSRLSAAHVMQISEIEAVLLCALAIKATNEEGSADACENNIPGAPAPAKPARHNVMRVRCDASLRARLVRRRREAPEVHG